MPITDWSTANLGHDWKAPNYGPIWIKRAERLQRLKKDPVLLEQSKLFYKTHPANFINDWGVTFDPRNVERGLPAMMPFILFERQWEWIEFVYRKWKEQEPGLTEKSRDMGISWLAVGFASTMCLFNEGMVIGFGSRKEEYVDKKDAPKSLFFKARMFIGGVPSIFRPGWDKRTHAPHMLIRFPHTGSFISGEAGDGIGRGDRAGIYFVDEHAHLEHPELVDTALSQTTNCQQDMSSVNGNANVFAIKRHSGTVEVFEFDWTSDPRKDYVWYQKEVARLPPAVVAQEIDRDYSASVEGVMIPSVFVRASIDAHVKLGIQPTGRRTASLDVADEGKDQNAIVGRHGVVIQHIEAWSGKGDDIFGTVKRAFDLCDALQLDGLKYDSDGLGAGVRGDARIINESRMVKINVTAFRGSESPSKPEQQDMPGRKNKDFFANKKAQAWWSLRNRFMRTYRWVVEGIPCDPDEIISISSASGDYMRLVTELSQPTYAINTAGKIVVDKAPDNTRSPNMADAVMMEFYNDPAPMRITSELLRQI